MKWYDPKADNPPWIKALAHPREGYCFDHVQAIMLSIDQYAESALGNREYFLNKPHSIGGKGDEIPLRSHDWNRATPLPGAASFQKDFPVPSPELNRQSAVFMIVW